MEEIEKKRVHLIDEIRGILIIYVILYHLTYDISEIFTDGFPWMYSSWMNTLRNTMTGSLMIIAGISCSFSKSNLKRGLKIFGIAMILTIVTALFIPGQLIIFGILHYFGVSIIIYYLFEKLLAKVPILIGMIVSFYFFFATFHIYEGYIGILQSIKIGLPDILEGIKIFYIFGFPIEGMHSADYYPLIPWIFLLFAGTFLGRYIKKGTLPNFAYKRHCSKLSYIGSRTLVIYLVHQPVIYGILYLIYLS